MDSQRVLRAYCGFPGATMFLCVCKAVRVSEAVDAARADVDTPESIRRHFEFDDDECCGRCAEEIDDLAVMVQVELCKSDGTAIAAPVLAAA